MVVVTPRLVVGLLGGLERPPTGEEVWGDTWLSLPNEPAGSRYQNLFTGETVQAAAQANIPGLALGTVLGQFPVALLAAVR